MKYSIYHVLVVPCKKNKNNKGRDGEREWVWGSITEITAQINKVSLFYHYCLFQPPKTHLFSFLSHIQINLYKCTHGNIAYFYAYIDICRYTNQFLEKVTLLVAIKPQRMVCLMLVSNQIYIVLFN